MRVRTTPRRRPRLARRRLMCALLAGGAALAASPSAVALDPTDGRQSVHAGGMTAPGDIAVAPGMTGTDRLLVYGDHALGATLLTPGTDNLLNIPTPLAGFPAAATPEGASQVAVQDDWLYIVDRSVGVVRVPWNPLTQSWNTAAAAVVEGTAALAPLRPDAVASDGEGNLYVGFITTDEIVKIASPSDTPVVVRDYATTASGLGTLGMAWDALTRTLFLAEADGVSSLAIPDPPGDGVGQATPLDGVDLLPAGGIALDPTGATWPDDPDGPGGAASTRNLLVGTARGVQQINLSGDTSVVPRVRGYAFGLLNVSGLHLLDTPLDTVGPTDLPAGTLLAGEDPSAGADGSNGQFVAITPGTPPPPPPPADPSHPIVGQRTTPADLAWDDNGNLWVTDHLAGPVKIIFSGNAGELGTVERQYNNGILPDIPGLPAAPFDSAGAIAFDQFGNGYITDNARQGTSAVWKIPAHPQTRVLQRAQITEVASFFDGGRQAQPDALAVDRDGNLYVGMTRSGEIAKISELQSDSPVVERNWATTSSGSPAAGLEVDPENRLLIAEGTVVTRLDLASAAPRVPSSWIDLPVVGGGPSMDAPSDMALAPDALYVLDDTEVIRIPLGAAPARTPDVNNATRRMDGFRIPGGLAADEAGRARPGSPGIPNPALFAGTDFPAEGTGVIYATDDQIPEPAFRTPDLGDVAHVVVTEPTGVLAGSVAPTAIVSRASLVDHVDFSLMSSDGSTQLADLGSDATPDAANGVNAPAFDTTTVPDGTYRLRATAVKGASTRVHDRVVTIDNVIPSVVFTSPADAQYVKPTQTLTVNDGDFVGVQRVEFKVNGATRLIDTAAPFRLFNFNFLATGDATPDLEAIVTFSKPFGLPANRVASSGVLPYRVDGQAPSVSIDTPTNGAVISGPTSIEATASDTWTPTAESSLASSELLFDGAQVASDPSGSLSASVDADALADGTYPIVANATDRAGNQAQAESSVIVDNVPPTVSLSVQSLSAPGALGILAGQVIGQDVRLSATASNAGTGVSGVQFFDGAALLGTDTSAPFSLDVTGLAPGAHSFRASALSSAHAAVESGVAPATVVPPPPPPPASTPPAPAAPPTNPPGGPGPQAATAPARSATTRQALPLVGGAIVRVQRVATTRRSSTVLVRLAAPSIVQTVVTTRRGKVVQRLRTVRTGKKRIAIRWNLKARSGKRVRPGIYRVKVRVRDSHGRIRTVTRAVRVRAVRARR